jgi:hypothetical protein
LEALPDGLGERVAALAEEPRLRELHRTAIGAAFASREDFASDL